MKLHILLILMFVLFALDAAAQSGSNEIAGKWQFEMKWTGVPDDEPDETLLTEVSALVVDVADGGEYTLHTNVEQVDGVIEARQADESISGALLIRDIHGETRKIPFAGRRVANEIYKGRFLRADGMGDWAEGISDWEWTIKAVEEIFMCSNHDPNHTALELEEMQALTAAHGCSEWHRLKQE